MSFFIFLTKYFFLTIGCLYCFHKVLSSTERQRNHFLIFLFSFVASLILAFIHTLNSSLTPFVELLFLVFYCYFDPVLRFKNLSLKLCFQILSLGINLVLFSCSLLFAAGLFYLLLFQYKEVFLVHFVSYLLAGFLQLLFLFALFRIRRFRKGISYLEENYSTDFGVIISLCVFFFYTYFFSKELPISAFICLFLFFLLLGGVIPICWHKYLSDTYLHRSQAQTIKLYEETLREQNDELKRLSQIIHKDNKLIDALCLSVHNLCSNPDLVTAQKIHMELDCLSKERIGILRKYETDGRLLSKTGIFSTDTILQYFFLKAVDAEIRFDLSITNNFQFIIDSPISETDLNTILADLIENAVHAVQKKSEGAILVFLSVSDLLYRIDIFDNGPSFSPEVLSNLGKKRFTTRASEGGSGIGLMSTLELTRHYMGSFEICTLSENNRYNKRVSVIFDSKNEVRITESK